MSTSLSREVALNYASTGPGVAFEITFSNSSRGANLEFLSQFPAEQGLSSRR